MQQRVPPGVPERAPPTVPERAEAAVQPSTKTRMQPSLRRCLLVQGMLIILLLFRVYVQCTVTKDIGVTYKLEFNHIHNTFIEIYEIF